MNLNAMLKKGLVNKNQARLLELQRNRLLRTETRKSVSDLAVENRFIKLQDIAESEVSYDHEIIDIKLAQDLNIMPLYIKDEELHVKTAQTLKEFDVNRIKSSATRNGFEVNNVVQIKTDPKEIFTWIRSRHSVNKQDLSEKVELLNKDPNNPVLIQEVSEGIYSLAIVMDVSDIHFRRDNDNEIQNIIEFRIDGILRTMFILSYDAMTSLFARIKNLADLDISNSFLPQDGRKSLDFKGRKVDMRVGTLPTNDGEKIVIRLLDPDKLMTLDEMFYPYPELLKKFKKLADIHTGTGGMIIVSGPTGSGKTTTNYAFIRELDRVSLNIVTAEDPVEYEMPLITQSQINNESGLTFPVLLRAQLRNDPDVILVGEMRDSETAEIATRSADTGHMIFTTLHTDDAISTVNRLVSMLPSNFESVGKKAISNNLKAIINQRLLRKLCSCKAKRKATKQEIEKLGLKKGSFVHDANGCDACEGTGYKGRVNAPEVLMLESKKTTGSEFRMCIEQGNLTKEIAHSTDSALYQDLNETCSLLLESGLIDVNEAYGTLEMDK